MKKILAISLLALLLVGMAVGRSVVQFANKEKEAANFASVVSQYLSTPLTEGFSDSPYRLGKVVMIDEQDATVDFWTHSKLPDHIRAQNPEEVGTVVFVDWIEEEIGEYRNVESGEYSGKATKISASVRVVDWSNKQVVGRRHFEGTAPPEGIRIEGDFAYERPMFDIVGFISTLPADEGL